MIIILEERTGTVELSEQVIAIYEVADFNIPSGINESIITEAGQLIVGLAAGTTAVIDEPNADGLVLTSNPTDPKKMEWRAAAAGGGSGLLTNKRGSEAGTGTVVVPHLDYDNSFATTTTPNDPRVYGVTAENVSNNAEGQIKSIGRAVVLVQGNVAIGEWLVSSTTDGRAKAAGYSKPAYGGIGIAMSAYSGGGSGQVDAWLMVQASGAIKGRGYILGGNTTARVATGNIIPYAVGITSVVSTSNLSSARELGAGVSGIVAGYAMGGYTGSNVATTDKVVYATDTTSAVAGANLSVARRAVAGVSGTDRGYAMGGYTSVAVVTTDKVVYATDTTSAVAGANLSVARQACSGVSGTDRGYAMGGYTSAVVVTTDKVVYATDTTSAVAGANLSVARYGAAGVSGTDRGYAMGGYTSVAVVTTDKVVYATDTTSAQVSANLSTARNNAAGLMGTQMAYVMGGLTTASSAVVDMVTMASDVTVLKETAQLPTANQSPTGIFANV